MKRGQAALEFVMAYGWAILVVLAAITTLAYTGVLSPNEAKLATCVFPPGVFCEDFSMFPDRMYFSLRNGGFDVYLSRVTIGTCVTNLNDTFFPTGASETVIMQFCNIGNPGSEYMNDVVVEYKSHPGLLTKSHIGEVKGLIQ